VEKDIERCTGKGKPSTRREGGGVKYWPPLIFLCQISSTHLRIPIWRDIPLRSDLSQIPTCTVIQSRRYMCSPLYAGYCENIFHAYIFNHTGKVTNIIRLRENIPHRWLFSPQYIPCPLSVLKIYISCLIFWFCLKLKILFHFIRASFRNKSFSSHKHPSMWNLYINHFYNVTWCPFKFGNYNQQVFEEFVFYNV
jgi:hypothetical protein